MRHICHIDESGDFGSLSPANPSAKPVQPTLVVVGVIVPEDNLARMEEEFQALKNCEFVKDRRNARIARIGKGESFGEDKGKDIFREALKSDSDKWRTDALSVLAAALDLLDRAEARVAGGVHIKPVGKKFAGRRAYTSSVLSIAENLRGVLEEGHPKLSRRRLMREGRIVCDMQEARIQSELHALWRGRELAPLEFADSRRRIGVQIADWLCSAVIAPLAAATCSNQRPESKHANPRYLALAGGENSVWSRLARMQFPFADNSGFRQPGILVHPRKFRAKLFPKNIPA